MNTGIELIAQEREEQISKHGWSASMDDTQTHVELARAALSVLCMDEEIQNGLAHYLYGSILWPWDITEYMHHNIEKKDRIGQLAVAGALIAAEIDRLQRAKEQSNP